MSKMAVSPFTTWWVELNPFRRRVFILAYGQLQTPTQTKHPTLGAYDHRHHPPFLQQNAPKKNYSANNGGVSSNFTSFNKFLDPTCGTQTPQFFLWENIGLKPSWLGVGRIQLMRCHQHRPFSGANVWSRGTCPYLNQTGLRGFSWVTRFLRRKPMFLDMEPLQMAEK